MNYTYTKLYELTPGNRQFDLDILWAGEKFGQRYSQLKNHAGTWDADIGYHDNQLQVTYFFMHSSDHVMFVLACG